VSSISRSHQRSYCPSRLFPFITIPSTLPLWPSCFGQCAVPYAASVTHSSGQIAPYLTAIFAPPESLERHLEWVAGIVIRWLALGSCQCIFIWGQRHKGTREGIPQHGRSTSNLLYESLEIQKFSTSRVDSGFRDRLPKILPLTERHRAPSPD
jgi:hypothetical protein